MDKINHRELARNYFLEGYNCTQALVLAFLPETGLPRETALAAASSFGGGMGRLREVCGAVSGMFLVAGLVYGYTEPKDFAGKSAHYERIQALAASFREKNGSIVCRELLKPGQADTSPIPEQRTEEYYKKRPCPDLIGDAAEILERFLQANPVTKAVN